MRRHQRGKTRVLDDGSSGGRKPQHRPAADSAAKISCVTPKR